MEGRVPHVVCCMVSLALLLNVTMSVLIKECSAFVFILAGLAKDLSFQARNGGLSHFLHGGVLGSCRISVFFGMFGSTVDTCPSSLPEAIGIFLAIFRV